MLLPTTHTTTANEVRAYSVLEGLEVDVLPELGQAGQSFGELWIRRQERRIVSMVRRGLRSKGDEERGE
jgi:hypothetical protein